MGDAGDLRCRIPVRLLDVESASSAAGTLSPVSTARLRTLACVFTGYLAYVLAGLYWFAFSGYSLCDHPLFCDAAVDQPCQNARKTKRFFLSVGVVVAAGADRGMSVPDKIVCGQVNALGYNTDATGPCDTRSDTTSALCALKFQSVCE